MNTFVADPGWGWWIIFYFYLGGLAAGCFFVATLIELFGQEEDRSPARIGYRVAFPLIVVCGVLLIVDLERPERFWHMLVQSEAAPALMVKWWSPMSIGAQALGIFGLCSFLSFLGSFWPSGRLARLLGSNLVGKTFKFVGCIVGFFVAAYTGALLTATNQPLWSVSDWIAPLFLTSAASTAHGLLLLLGGRVLEASRERLERADLWALGLELYIFLIFLASLGAVLPWVLKTWEGLLLVVGTLSVGLLLPLWLHLGFKTPNSQRVSAAALCALAGGFLLRFGIVQVSPALLHGFPNLTPSDVNVPLWQSWAGKGLLGLTVVLAVLIPYVLARTWELSPRQAAMAGMVCLLVLGAVSVYTFNPATAQPVLDPAPGLSISPEDQRPRGGGPGASANNRPSKPYLRGKITETDAP